MKSEKFTTNNIPDIGENVTILPYAVKGRKGLVTDSAHRLGMIIARSDAKEIAYALIRLYNLPVKTMKRNLACTWDGLEGAFAVGSTRRYNEKKKQISFLEGMDNGKEDRRPF